MRQPTDALLQTPPDTAIPEGSQTVVQDTAQHDVADSIVRPMDNKEVRENVQDFVTIGASIEDIPDIEDAERGLLSNVLIAELCGMVADLLSDLPDEELNVIDEANSLLQIEQGVDALPSDSMITKENARDEYGVSNANMDDVPVSRSDYASEEHETGLQYVSDEPQTDEVCKAAVMDQSEYDEDPM